MRYKVWLANGDNVEREAENTELHGGCLSGVIYDDNDDRYYDQNGNVTGLTVRSFAAGQWTHCERIVE